MGEGRGAVGNGRFLLAVSKGNYKILIAKIKLRVTNKDKMRGIKGCYFETLISFLNAFMTLL